METILVESLHVCIRLFSLYSINTVLVHTDFYRTATLLSCDAVGSPVKGFKLKTTVVQHLTELGHEIIDVGCYDTDRFVKYPAIGERVAKALADGVAELAISFCGSGAGAAISTNKFAGVLAK